MNAYVDLKVTVHMLTRTCACGCSGEFPYMPAKKSGRGIDTWRQAADQRDAWWDDHAGKCGKANAA